MSFWLDRFAFDYELKKSQLPRGSVVDEESKRLQASARLLAMLKDEKSPLAEKFRQVYPKTMIELPYDPASTVEPWFDKLLHEYPCIGTADFIKIFNQVLEHADTKPIAFSVSREYNTYGSSSSWYLAIRWWRRV